MASQLLAFGRRQPLNPKPTDVGPLVSSFKDLLRRTLGEAIELRIEIVGSAHRLAAGAGKPLVDMERHAPMLRRRKERIREAFALIGFEERSWQPRGLVGVQDLTCL